MKENRDNAKKASKELFPLMFEMGRLLKHQFTVDGCGPSSYLHLETLRYIKEAKTPGMGDVADYLRIAAPSATALVQTLVKDGYLLRKPDASDRRRVNLVISQKGEQLLKDAAARREKAFARITAHLSDADRIELARILSIITKQPS